MVVQGAQSACKAASGICASRVRTGQARARVAGHIDTYPVGAAKSGTASRDEACAAGQGLRQARRSQQLPPSCCRYHGCTADGFSLTRFLPIHIHLTHNLTSSTSTPIPTGPGLQPANAQTSTNTANTNPRLRHAYTQAMEAHMHPIQMIQ
ncbi:hypothetical protein CCHR01_09074 [Colletotrichum chrysophilum]|uniref:Uncharacterized protein n=1 Tax=Colletotrichum chrysophilum TaxID=1836956 RepID=A0AAD9AIK9_9PEZI|nr:hypothetical protein CCHR01_09074 [Colletotrichum chrysophilum]